MCLSGVRISPCVILNEYMSLEGPHMQVDLGSASSLKDVGAEIGVWCLPGLQADEGGRNTGRNGAR